MLAAHTSILGVLAVHSRCSAGTQTEPLLLRQLTGTCSEPPRAVSARPVDLAPAASESRRSRRSASTVASSSGVPVTRLSRPDGLPQTSWAGEGLMPSFVGASAGWPFGAAGFSVEPPRLLAVSPPPASALAPGSHACRRLGKCRAAAEEQALPSGAGRGRLPASGTASPEARRTTGSGEDACRRLGR